jgi:ribosomal protein S3
MTLLLGENKITPKTYLIILAQIFRNLTKKKHTRFIFCFKFVFNYLLLFSEIKGIKFIINGKLLGKTRASTLKIEKGSISINTKSVNLMFGKIEVHTLYGVFGFKLWLNYK